MTRTVRVAHVMAGAAEGGAELFFERLCLAQHRAGDAVLPAIRANPARAALLRQGGMEPVELRFGTALDVLTRPLLARSLRHFAPSVAVAWMNRANQHMPRGEWVRVGRLGGYYDLRYYRGCDYLVGNTRGIAAWLREQGWPEDRVRYLPNFVSDFAATRAVTRASLGVPDDVPLLLGLGRLHSDKGFDTAIRALTRVKRAWLLIAGSGKELVPLQALASREGVGERVLFLGWRNDPGSLLKVADVFVCSSRIEPLGNMIIEAWSASRPIVAVAADGPRELIQDGRDGLLVAHENSEQLAEALRVLIEDRQRAVMMAEIGRQRFETEFSETCVLAQWRDYLDGLRPN